MLQFLHTLAVQTMIAHQAGALNIDVDGIKAYVDDRLDTILNREK